MTQNLRVIALLALVAPLACAPKTSSGPTPRPGPAGAVRQTCPDSSDGASIIVDAIESAHRALVASPSTPLPPACVVVAFAQIETPVADSTSEHGLSIATELGKRGPATAELIASEVTLLSRLDRHADVVRAYDRLIVVDAAPSMNVVRLALGAAHKRADTATLLRVISKAAARRDAPMAVRMEHDVLRSIGRLWTAVNQAQGFIRQNPRNATMYPSIVANFGTLALPDSVAAYARQGIAQGVTRAALTPSIESFVGTMQRHASLYGSTYDWDRAIVGVARVDSAFTTPSTKFLVASFLVQSAGPAVAVAGVDVKADAGRADACRRLTRAASMLDVAETQLRSGGDRHTPSAVSSLRGAMTATRGRIEASRGPCAGE